MNKGIVLIGLTILASTLLYIQTQDNQLQNGFSLWKERHGKSYSYAEEYYRFKVYSQNLLLINTHNAKKNKSYTMEANKFADLTDEEFVAIYLNQGTYVNNSDVKLSRGVHPPNADWESRMNPLKNQGKCGSCWTFSAVGAVEAYWIITQNFKGVLSEQQLVDCALDAGDGCNGGNSDDALDYVTKTGLVYEKDYPYTGEQGTCKVTKGVIYINGRENLDQDEDRMKKAIAEYPISVSVDATNWKFYKEGIFEGECRDDYHNHAVVAVGYDYNENWKIRNSWGPDYGVNGHIWLAPGNTCAVMTRADRAI